jgi:group I intron endonuclease
MKRFYNRFENKNFNSKFSILHNFSDHCNNIVFKHAIKIYNDPLNQRNLIRKDINSKAGIYSWVNKVNDKLYIGSGDPLYLRISDYYQNWYFLSRPNLYIVRALYKYGMDNFILVILEYSDSKNLISCEQKWINFFKPEYNISLIAINTKGNKHTIKNIDTKQIKKVKQDHIDENNNFYGKKHKEKSLILLKTTTVKRNKSPVLGLEVKITDIKTKITTVYESIRKAAVAIGSDIKTILRREKSQINKGINTPYRKRYIIVIKR